MGIEGKCGITLMGHISTRLIHQTQQKSEFRID